MIPDGAHTSTIQRFILRSLPVSQILRQWAGVRDLQWKEEESLPPRILERLNELGWIARDGGPLLGDRKRCRAGLIYRKRTNGSVSAAEYITDLKDHLKSCGRRSDDFVIFRPGQLNLSYNVEPDAQPLFFLFWAPERPPLERLLGGRQKLPFTLLAEGGPAAEAEPASVARKGPSLPSSVAEEHGDWPEESIQDVAWKDQGFCRYALLGSTRGNRSFKFFIKYSTDHLRVFLFSSAEEISEDFLGAMFDALGHHDDPVQGYLEQIRVAVPRDILGLSLSLSAEGLFEYCGFGLTPALLRNGRAPRNLPDLKSYYRKFPSHRWRVARGRLKAGDRILLCPSTMLSSELDEFAIKLRSGRQASSWLRSKSLGKALLLESRPF